MRERDTATTPNAAGVKPSPLDGLRAPQHRLTYGIKSRPRRETLIANVRIKEIERLIQHRHGGAIPDADDSDRNVYLVAQHLRELGDGLEWRLAVWCNKWAPDLSTADIRRIAERVLARPRRFSAQSMADLLGLTLAERTALEITTIGATDVSSDERAQQQAAKKRERNRKYAERKRRAKGAVPRAEYLDNSLSKTRPWENQGVHRRTWERQRARAAASSSPMP